jgi:GT2 family glycosyltransferase
MPIFTFIIVNYRSASLLPAWFESLIHTHLGPDAYEVIVANNDPDESAQLLALQQDYTFQLFEQGSNRGFGAAVNNVAPQAQGSLLCLSNPDTRFVSSDWRTLSQYWSEGTHLGILGPQLIDRYGQPERWSRGTTPTLWHILRNNLGFSADARLNRLTTLHQVDWVSGATLIIPTALFQKIHGFDEDFFLYFEDVDLCQRVRNQGFTVKTLPELRIRHLGGRSMGSLCEQKRHFFHSQKKYFHKHRSRLECFLLDVFHRLMLISHRN